MGCDQIPKTPILALPNRGSKGLKPLVYDGRGEGNPAF